jgi:hypothetical protein
MLVIICGLKLNEPQNLITVRQLGPARKIRFQMGWFLASLGHCDEKIGKVCTRMCSTQYEYVYVPGLFSLGKKLGENFDSPLQSLLGVINIDLLQN